MGGVFVESLKLAVPLTEAMAANMERIAAANGSMAAMVPGSPATIVIGGGGPGGGGGVTYGSPGSSPAGSWGTSGSPGSSPAGSWGTSGSPGSSPAGSWGTSGSPGSSPGGSGGALMSTRDGAAIVGALKTLGDRLEKVLSSGGLANYFRATGGL